jgi:hypothetical protein
MAFRVCAGSGGAGASMDGIGEVDPLAESRTHSVPCCRHACVGSPTTGHLPLAPHYLTLIEPTSAVCLVEAFVVPTLAPSGLSLCTS